MSRIEDGGAVEAGLVERLLDSGPADYVSLRLKNNEWSGSAYIAGEKVTDPAWHRSGLYRHLCHVGTYLSAAESLAEDAISAAAEITRLRAENAGMREALDRIVDIHRRNFGRQTEKLADIEPIALAALSKPSHAEGGAA